LKRQPEWRLRLRLTAIDMALSGKSPEEAAATANVQPGVLKHWLRIIRQRGIVEALQGWERRAGPLKLNTDAMVLRELAAKETSPRIRKRFLALAEVADGRGICDASAISGLNHEGIAKWIRRYEKSGAVALREKGARSCKLSAVQLSELRSVVAESPEITGNELRDLIWTPFCVRYSRSGAARLLTKILAQASGG